MKIKPTDTVTVDDLSYPVSTLPDNIKYLVEVYDELRRDHGRASVDLLKSQAGMDAVSQKIAAAVQQMKREAEQKAAETEEDNNE